MAVGLGGGGFPPGHVCRAHWQVGGITVRWHDEGVMKATTAGNGLKENPLFQDTKE